MSEFAAKAAVSRMIKDQGLAISCKHEGSQHVAVGVCMRNLETFCTCGCTARVVACIEDPMVIEKILTHLDETAPAKENDPFAREPGTPTGLLVRLINREQ